MSDFKYVLNANKTKMYKLVKEKSPYPLPIMKNTKFSRTSIFRMYDLEWVSSDGLSFVADLSAVCGVAYLLIRCIVNVHEESYTEDFYTLDVEYLKENGLVKEKKPSAIKSKLAERIMSNEVRYI